MVVCFLFCFVGFFSYNLHQNACTATTHMWGNLSVPLTPSMIAPQALVSNLCFHQLACAKNL